VLQGTDKRLRTSPPRAAHAASITRLNRRSRAAPATSIDRRDPIKTKRAQGLKIRRLAITQGPEVPRRVYSIHP